MSYYRLHLQPPNKDFIMEAYRSTMKVYNNVSRCEFSHGSYEEACIDGKTIYADPPYINNKFKTKYFQGFDHEKFWNIMRTWSSTNLVFISERVAPDDFVCIWSFSFKVALNKSKTTRTVEKIFIHNTWSSKIDEVTLNKVRE